MSIISQFERHGRRASDLDRSATEQMMRHAITITLALLCLSQTGCTHDPFAAPVIRASSSVPSHEDMLAYGLQRDADLVVSFLDWRDLRIWKPSNHGDQGQLTRDAFVRSLDSFPDLDRRFAVVVMDKRWSVARDRVTLDEVEHFMSNLGFRRIVFQQARSALAPGVGFPILRDTHALR